MIPNENFILTKKDLGSFIYNLRELRKNDTKSFEIIKNANKMAQ
jgi:hypothetical protein